MQLREPTPAMYATAVVLALLAWKLTRPPTPPQTGRRYQVLVRYVYDGDTFETSTGVRVRLLGIDSPEVARDESPAEFYADESTIWLRQLVEGKRVIMEEGVEAYDRYGRTLAWIWLDDGRLVSELALQTGNAELLDRFGLPLHLESRLRQAEQSARDARLGMWAQQP